jgi:excisionase family DNA binding protein
MENPFELILEKLNSIENLLKHQKGIEPIITPTQPLKEVLTLKEAAEFLCQSKSSLYKKTMNWTIPHYKIGGTIFFKRAELFEWIEKHRVKTREEIEREALENIPPPRSYRR